MFKSHTKNFATFVALSSFKASFRLLSCFYVDYYQFYYCHCSVLVAIVITTDTCRVSLSSIFCQFFLCFSNRDTKHLWCFLHDWFSTSCWFLLWELCFYIAILVFINVLFALFLYTVMYSHWNHNLKVFKLIVYHLIITLKKRNNNLSPKMLLFILLLMKVGIDSSYKCCFEQDWTTDVFTSFITVQRFETVD